MCVQHQGFGVLQAESSEEPEILRAEAAQKGRWEKEDAPQRRRDHLIHGHRRF